MVSLHSGLTPAQRLRHWLLAHLGRADLVLGTRLAVFASMPRLGLIVVDEEHDPSFKQQEGARYSARDLAVWRAHRLGISVLLGSATPSLETWQRALEGRYLRLALDRRIGGGVMPAVRLVDMTRLPRDAQQERVLAPPVLAAIQERIEPGEQSLLLLNRRGYAPVLFCGACGWKSGCPHCSAWRVFHKADRTLRCHHCGLTERVPRACPDCGNLDIHPFGRGTQRLEAAIAERFPEARVLRIDRDSASTPKKWSALLDAIHAGEADILIGTQMLAKGHDFPKLTLVGVVGADAALFAADFRAPERLFAQLMQVGGRSGRAALAGEVLIQTEHPAHPLYQALIAQDYAAFAATQLAEREQAGFPPYVFQALLRAEAKQLDTALAFLIAAREAATALAGEVMLYDPVPMRLFRKMTLERAQLLVESASRPALQAFLVGWVGGLYNQKAPRDLRWHIDVDPLEF
jgi:primosomal protein N' (replication factor Y)